MLFPRQFEIEISAYLLDLAKQIVVHWVGHCVCVCGCVDGSLCVCVWICDCPPSKNIPDTYVHPHTHLSLPFPPLSSPPSSLPQSSRLSQFTPSPTLYLAALLTGRHTPWTVIYDCVCVCVCPSASERLYVCRCVYYKVCKDKMS